ncbi:MAG: NTP transferase domain-containing protein [Mogibacterium sp.]|nr:NTP transferase domain-containing protein [Mogibacterium sp.]
MKYGAVIVAAGMSTRMKQFKQLMKIGNMSFAERVITNFRRAGVQDIVMVTGYQAEQLEKALRDFGITFVRNENYAETQMFDSVRLGFARMQGKCDRLFFCPVDVPFFTDETVLREIRAMYEEPSVKVVVPVCGGRDGHPLLIDSSVLPDILAHDGNRGLKGAYESLPAGTVLRMEVEDEGAVTDADTMEDYQKLMDIHNNRILHSDVRIRFASTAPFFGPGTVRLLRGIEETGNVRDACEKIGCSYSKGWTIIKSCEEKFGYRIVDRQQGGQNGGAAQVTEKGHQLLAVYDELQRAVSEYTEERFQELMRKHDLIR